MIDSVDIDISPEVKLALTSGEPLVALESTIISHGMPFPQNLETAQKVEKIIRDGRCSSGYYCHFKRQN